LVSKHFPWPKKGIFVFSFCKIFSREEKEGGHFRLRYEALRDEFGKKNWVFEFLSEKYPISKNKSAETGVQEVKL
jgi:hypothetical protein